jgi:hypothetical protein
MDVSSGICSRAIELEPLLKTTIVSIKANSRYLVMMDLLKTYEFNTRFDPIRKKGTNMFIFDLNAIRKKDNEQDVLLNHNVVRILFYQLKWKIKMES